MAATSALLAERRFDEIAVTDILARAQVSRASFYFYFASKQDVLAELVRRAVSAGHQAAAPWLSHDAPPTRRQTITAGISGGAELWREQAPVLRAIVENWQTDPRLTELWQSELDTYTDAANERIRADRRADPDLPRGVDARALAAALTWLGERLYYLAAIGVPPFDDQEVLVSVLTHIWMSSVYGER